MTCPDVNNREDCDFLTLRFLFVFKVGFKVFKVHQSSRTV